MRFPSPNFTNTLPSICYITALLDNVAPILLYYYLNWGNVVTMCLHHTKAMLFVSFLHHFHSTIYALFVNPFVHWNHIFLLGIILLCSTCTNNETLAFLYYYVYCSSHSLLFHHLCKKIDILISINIIHFFHSCITVVVKSFL